MEGGVVSAFLDTMNGMRKVLVAGASGLIGAALRREMVERGWSVMRLVRREARGADEVQWDPARGEMARCVMEEVSAVVNLSGENVGAGRWTEARKEAILRSRVDATRTLVEAMRRTEKKPGVLVNASAVGIYGDRADEVLNECAERGRGFLAEVCRAWEAEAQAAAGEGVRVAVLRLGVVLAEEGGALAKMLPVFRMGLGGKIGDGKQWMSWVSLEDAVGGLRWAVEEERAKGVFNLSAPQPVRNEAFSKALGRMLGRPAVMPVPAVVVKTIFGQMGEEALLASQRAVPERLLAEGFRFRHAEIEGALRAAFR